MNYLEDPRNGVDCSATTISASVLEDFTALIIVVTISRLNRGEPPNELVMDLTAISPTGYPGESGIDRPQSFLFLCLAIMPPPHCASNYLRVSTLSYCSAICFSSLLSFLKKQFLSLSNWVFSSPFVSFCFAFSLIFFSFRGFFYPTFTRVQLTKDDRIGNRDFLPVYMVGARSVTGKTHNMRHTRQVDHDEVRVDLYKNGAI